MKENNDCLILIDKINFNKIYRKNKKLKKYLIKQWKLSNKLRKNLELYKEQIGITRTTEMDLHKARNKIMKARNYIEFVIKDIENYLKECRNNRFL